QLLSSQSLFFLHFLHLTLTSNPPSPSNHGGGVGVTASFSLSLGGHGLRSLSLTRWSQAGDGGAAVASILPLFGLRDSLELVSGEIETADRQETKGETTILSHH
ncbi:hypothetical protein LINGRAHAP2_LOCUS7437, partial [Linum grandiflorum]